MTGASLVCLYSLYHIYKTLKTQQALNAAEKEEKKRQQQEPSSCCGGGACKSGPGGDTKENIVEPVYISDSEDDDVPSIGGGSHDGPLLDIEDLGSAAVNPNAGSDSSSDSGVLIHRKDEDLVEKFKDHEEMIDDTLRATLTKQGYKLVGSHSGVKLCRWTKSMLRGQGGCYKHTFYGIASHQCMESTPNLACANKCVFCWRHQKNPTGTEWKWKLDDAKLVFNGLVQNHYNMIKQFKGVPGVTAESLAEAKKLRHAALSLVGEPIMYPEINRFIGMLHENGISSFLVTNGTFPECIRLIRTVTQLYLSVDAPTEKSHKQVDRPLFKDAWSRFIKSCENLAQRKERTIFRLTMVKGWNDEEMEQYSKLVEVGKPDMIEIKGVTYCGNSWAGNTEDKAVLAMKNVPFHEEVLEMCQVMVDSINEQLGDNSEMYYEIMSEHAHSNCVLIANKKKFFINNVWHTHIDFDKFIELEASGEDFTALDYSIPTPDWAIFGHESHGFDPAQTRVYRKGANKRAQKQQQKIDL